MGKPFATAVAAMAPSALLGLLLVGAPGLAAQEAAGEDLTEACFGCHTDSGSQMEFDCETEVDIDVDRIRFLESAHGKLGCMACHADLEPMEHAFADERGTFADYRENLNANCAACHSGSSEHPDAPPITQLMHPADAADAPLCTDCHSAHAARRAPAAHASMSQSCATCHADAFASVAGSAHAAGVIDAGHRDLPSCTTCHSGHEDSGSGPAARDVRLGQPCMGCHQDTELMGRYDLSTDVVDTYLQDFHGTSLHLYKQDGTAARNDPLRTLVCADCHGVHDVARMSNGGAAELKRNLRQVCATCHEGATENFPDAWLSHYRPSLETAPVVFGVKAAYLIFIPFVILGLAIQIFAHLVLLPRRKRRLQRAGIVAEPHGGPRILPGDDRRMVRRFNRWQRIEHLLGMVTFILLLVTGLPQKFWQSDWAASLITALGGIDAVRLQHRVIGIAFAVLCLLHLMVVVARIASNRAAPSMVPTRKDFRDALQNLRYYFGLRERPPQFDRYDYKQKFEYWGMLVGSAVMIASGFVLLFPSLFATYLPGQMIPAAKMMHSWEAMMAFLTIVVWHLYGALLNPDCPSADKSVFTGKISVARMKHEHALEWQREADRLAVEEPSEATASDTASPGSGDSLAAGRSPS